MATSAIYLAHARHNRGLLSRVLNGVTSWNATNPRHVSAFKNLITGSTSSAAAAAIDSFLILVLPGVPLLLVPALIGGTRYFNGDSRPEACHQGVARNLQHGGGSSLPYDKAAIDFRGPRAKLNFPFPDINSTPAAATGTVTPKITSAHEINNRWMTEEKDKVSMETDRGKGLEDEIQQWMMTEFDGDNYCWDSTVTTGNANTF
ncbi:hypothetical protein F3Y22_tig00110339pilonHSYRG00070 [Hibiscus syriacus]|uniref:Uncharacterized protein n=1 Tax=Hibiscus syriacus TaxID=106335 RepID=A0A6A3AVR6_HIBSY|nr:hypothetical protein F3Y22_tig00110339pilonHSYRG00070 [Hibiscus syriacus]